jgi:hypothetical protein
MLSGRRLWLIPQISRPATTLNSGRSGDIEDRGSNLSPEPRWAVQSPSPPIVPLGIAIIVVGKEIVEVEKVCTPALCHGGER